MTEQIRPATSGGGGAVATDTIWDAKGDLAGGTGADTAAKLTVGANDTILMADSAQTTGLKWVAAATPSTQAFGDTAAAGTADTFTRGDHKHAMPVDPFVDGASSQASGTGDVTITGSLQDLTGATLSLAAGTYIISGTFDVLVNSALNDRTFEGHLDSGGSDQNDVAPLVALGLVNDRFTVSQTWRLVLASTTTVKLRGQYSGGTAGDFTSKGANTTITAYQAGGGGGGGLDLSALTIERSIQGVSDYVAAYDASAADERGFPVGMLPISRQHFVVREECFFKALGQYYDGAVIHQPTGSGATIAAVADAQASHPGIISLTTGTTTTGKIGMMLNNNGGLILANGKVRAGIVFRIVTALSDGTQTYTVRLGLFNDPGQEPADGVYFRYTDSVNAGEWQGVGRTSDAETTLDTNVAADTNWHTFEFEVNAAGSSVEFFIDGTSVGTVASNIPTSTLRFAPCNIIKSAGITARIFHLDAYWYALEFTTAR